jgi:hypothetical protein
MEEIHLIQFHRIMFDTTLQHRIWHFIPSGTEPAATGTDFHIAIMKYRGYTDNTAYEKSLQIWLV